MVFKKKKIFQGLAGQGSKIIKIDFLFFCYSAPHPATPEQRLPIIPARADRLRSPTQPILALQDLRLGFQVDRIKNAEQGEGKVRLTAYYASTGKVRLHYKIMFMNIQNPLTQYISGRGSIMHEKAEYC